MLTNLVLTITKAASGVFFLESPGNNIGHMHLEYSTNLIDWVEVEDSPDLKRKISSNVVGIMGANQLNFRVSIPDGSTSLGNLYLNRTNTQTNCQPSYRYILKSMTIEQRMKYYDEQEAISRAQMKELEARRLKLEEKEKKMSDSFLQ